MRKVFLAVPALILALVGCDSSNDAVGIGAVTGAALGAIVSDDGNKLGGAAVGGALGAAVGAASEPSQRAAQCRYTYSDGRSVVRPCQ
jgi:uncharacterized lipoprotein NlpE involved in copper resistance